MAKVTGCHGVPPDADIPELDIPEADRTLQTVCFHLDTGNQCLMTPCMKRFGHQCRIAFIQRWLRTPTDDEIQAMRAQIEEVSNLGAPDQVLGPVRASGEQLVEAASHFLSGRKAN